MEVDMKGRTLAAAISVVFLTLVLMACGGEPAVDVKKLMASPKAFVGSDTCKMCHLEHFDSWMMTLHSRMTQDVQKNRDVIIADFDEKRIREDLAKLGDKLKVPADKIFIPKIEDIKYTIGSQWKQRYIIEKGGVLYIAPIQYNADTDRWVNYNEATWEKNPWLLKCGGCHATGVDLDKQKFVEPAVGCEACHGKGSWHAALPKTAVFEKRQTIVNPAKLTMGVATEICGSCHNRGKATKHKDAEWAVGFEPGKALGIFFKSTSFAGGDANHLYGNEFSKAHHQQYIDWKQSKHFNEGVTCTSCHFVHQMGVPPTRTQTQAAGSKQCFQCHVQINQNMAHSIHSFANCVGCHMPRVVTSAESGDLHSHVFKTLLPSETLKDKSIPNSCQTCHKHKNQDLQELQTQWETLAKIPKPVGKPIEPISYKQAPAKK
jgi:Doubled CXXCH motif (Paired_CXXCH_1)/Cytochrome c554 and c-prime